MNEQNKKLAIIQSNHIPWKGYFDMINMVDELILYDDCQYTKRDWRNRNKIKTQNGSQWLTFPVEVKGKYQQKIKDTVISDQEWSKKHWSAIKYNYSKAAFFTTEYITGPSARTYMNIDYFIFANIRVTFKKYGSYPVYKQLHGGFNDAVSIVDLLFNIGINNAINYIRPKNQSIF